MGLLSQIGKLLTDNKPVTAAMYSMDPASGQEKGDPFVFQYFPETINDTKSPNYDMRNAPGGSHPIIQFKDGGTRTISFSAIFTQDKKPEDDSGLLGTLGNLLQGNLSVSLTGDGKDTVLIEDAIAKLRAYTYPQYKGGVAMAPPTVLLFLPYSGIVGHPNFKDSITAVMTECGVNYLAFHRSGQPRIVEVSLSFVETIQISNNWKYVSYDDISTKVKNDLGKEYSFKSNFGKAAPSKSSQSKQSNVISLPR